MSLFDRFHVVCPECKAQIIFQSKAMPMPCSRDYTVLDVPDVILASLNKSYVRCHTCGHKVIIISKTKGWIR